MAWDRSRAGAALAVVLMEATAELTPPCSVFAQPVATYNPPALVVQYPALVTLHQPAFAVDTADISVLAVAGLDDPYTVDVLLAAAAAAVQADPQLDGNVQLARPTELRPWRIATVAGADYLMAELALEIRM